MEAIMRRGRVFFYLAFILILVLIAAGVVYVRFIQPSRTAAIVEPTATPVPVMIVIVAQNIPKGYILDKDVLTTIPWQLDALAPGMIKGENLNEYYGRQVKYDLQAGTPLLDTMMIKDGEQISSAGSAWALNIPPGMVAVSIPINRLTSVSYAPRPGDHVNVIVTMMFVDVDTDFQSITPDQTGVVIAAGPPVQVCGDQCERNPLTLYMSNGVYGRTEIDPVLGQAVYLVPSEGQRPRIVSQMLLQDAIVLQVGEFPIIGQEQVQPQPTPTPVPGQEPAPPVVQKPTLLR
jgi:pilus assembly protein CpaB